MKYFYAERNKEVITAGTPISLALGTSYDSRITEIEVMNNYNDSTIFVVGEKSTVDAQSSPIIGKVIKAGDSVKFPVAGFSVKLYIDSSSSTVYATVHYYADGVKL